MSYKVFFHYIGLVALLCNIAPSFAFNFLHNDKQENISYTILQIDNFCSGLTGDCFKTLLNYGESDGCEYNDARCNCTLKADNCQSFIIVKVGGDFSRCSLDNVPANANVVINSAANNQCDITVTPTTCQKYSNLICKASNNQIEMPVQ